MKETDRIDVIIRANARLIQVNDELVRVNERWQEVVIKLLAMLKEAKEKGSGEHEADLQ